MELTESIKLSDQLEKNGFLKFQGIDGKQHEAKVSDGLIILDDEFSITWDTFTHIYLRCGVV